MSSQGSSAHCSQASRPFRRATCKNLPGGHLGVKSVWPPQPLVQQPRPSVSRGCRSTHSEHLEEVSIRVVVPVRPPDLSVSRPALPGQRDETLGAPRARVKSVRSGPGHTKDSRRSGPFRRVREARRQDDLPRARERRAAGQTHGLDELGTKLLECPGRALRSPAVSITCSPERSPPSTSTWTPWVRPRAPRTLPLR